MMSHTHTESGSLKENFEKKKEKSLTLGVWTKEERKGGREEERKRRRINSRKWVFLTELHVRKKKR